MRLRRFYSCLFTVGMVFLFNPVVSLLDVLPDFIGCLFIAAAMTELAMLDERLENARRLIYYLAGVSGVRTVLMFFMFNMDESAVLSCVSLLGVAELFAAIYFAISFFGGISYIAQRSESDNVLGNVDRIKRLWILFFVLHTAATVLPELAALPQLTLHYDPDLIPWLTEGRLILYKNYVTLILGTLSFALGVWWFRQTHAFFGGVKADERFKASLEQRYGTFIAANPLQNLFLDIRFACIAFAIGCGLQFNLTMDGIAVLPAWLGTVFIALAVWRVGGAAKNTLLMLSAAAVVQALSVHLLTSGALNIVGAVLFVPAAMLAVYVGENALATRVKTAIDWDIRGDFILARIFYGAFFVLSAVYRVWANYWLHLARILCFAAWIAAVVWLCSALVGELKLRRRL